MDCHSSSSVGEGEGGCNVTGETTRVNSKLGHHSTINDLPVEVLELILRQVKFVQLKSARLVCRDWNDEICRMMDKKIYTYIQRQYRIPNQVTVDSYINLQKQAVSLNLPSLLQAIRFDFDSPYFKVAHLKTLTFANPDIFAKIEHLAFAPTSGKVLFNNDEILRLFIYILNLCAENLTHLDLSRANWSTLNAVGILLSIRPNGFPELRSYDFPDECYLTDLPATSKTFELQYTIMREIERMLQLCPKLRSLIYPEDSWNCNAKGLLERGPYDFRQIEDLDIPLDCNFRKILQQFQREHLPNLKSLHLTERIDSKDNYGAEPETCEFLRCFAPTLEYLHLDLLDFDFSFENCVDTFPIMPVVSTLILAFPYGENVELGAKWLYKFPALKKIECGKLDLREIPGLTTIEPHQSLEDIKCRCILREDKVITPEVLEAVKTNFPNFKSWHIFEIGKRGVKIMDFDDSDE